MNIEMDEFVFRLREKKKMNFRQIAKKTNLNVSNVFYRYLRAKERVLEKKPQ